MNQASANGYDRPPREHNAKGEVRKVGLEIELAGLTLDRTLALVQQTVGGEIELEGRAQGHVRDTPFGKFKVEFDSTPLKERSYLRPLELIGIEPQSSTADFVEQSVLEVAREIVPIEIVTPPVAWNRLHELDPLWKALRDAGAEDTRSSILYAFGLHLNPEVPDGDAATLLSFIRSFLLLEDWIIGASQIDLSRRIAPYVRPFPEAYRRKVLQLDYAPDGRTLVDDYLAHNPTRNRTVDLLPLFVHLFGDDWLTRVQDAPLVKARPTFHYRLPNCDLAQRGWTPAADWNRWVMVEQLADNPSLLRELSAAYLDTLDLPLRLQSSGWIDQVRARLSLPSEASRESHF